MILLQPEKKHESTRLQGASFYPSNPLSRGSRSRVQNSRSQKEQPMKRIAVFPGSFDPITLGHRSIVLRALPMFDEIYVAVGINMEKRSTFELQDRIAWCKAVFADYPNVKVESYEGLTADFCKKVGANTIIRGLRCGSDFEYENMIGHANKRLHPELETIFLLTESELVGVSSSVVRDIYKNGGDTSKFLPAEVKLPEKQ